MVLHIRKRVLAVVRGKFHASGINSILAILGILFLLNRPAAAQSIRLPWSGYCHDAQHSSQSAVASQPLSRILWETPVDLDPQYWTGELLIHYGCPLITRSNTIIVPVKTGAYGDFQVEAHSATTGAPRWILTTDYILPAHDWTPGFSPALTPKNRLYFPGGGGTVFYCDTPDTTNATPSVGRLAFYGMTNFLAASNTYLNNVLIDTPIASDRYGNIYFGFVVTGANPANLSGGLARIGYDGTGSWIAASNLASDSSMLKVAMNCSPALSQDHRTVYVAVNDVMPGGNTFSAHGYLVAADARTLVPTHHIALQDPNYPGSPSDVNDDGTSSPTIGPDGDVFYGVLENPIYYNNDRGWLLHFDANLTTNKFPGAFGWDDTASVLPASIVPSYHGTSKYLLMTKYNNYADPPLNGNGVNKIAILDPSASQIDPVTGGTVMKEVLTIAGPTPDPKYRNAQHPNAVREWCINTAAVDIFGKCVLANCEDGNIYRWDLTSNTFTQTNTLLAGGIGEAYTPTLIGVGGIVYAINNATLFALGK